MSTIVTSISVTVDPDSLFGSDSDEGYDVQASVSRFADMLFEAIKGDFPEASIEVTMESTYDNKITVTTEPATWSDSTENEYVQGRVGERISDVYSGRCGDWAIY